MNTIGIHKTALTATRVLVAILFMVAIWAAPSILSNVCASIGTVMWLFMPQVVWFEEKVIVIIKENL